MTTQSATIDIQGMNCGHCVAKVQGALTGTPGVQTASVQLDPPAAQVTFDPAAASMATLMKAVTAAGFTPTAFRRS